MKLVLCSVQDTVAGVYSRPFCARSDAEAQRIFAQICVEDPTVSKSPSDYRLYRLGTFDELEGEVEGERARQLMGGQEPVKPENGAKAPGRLRQFLRGAR